MSDSVYPLTTMTITTYFLYLAAVALLVLSPGPTMLMCITTAVQHGPRKAIDRKSVV